MSPGGISMPKGKATSRRQFTFLSIASYLYQAQAGICVSGNQEYHLFGSCLVVVCCSSSLILDSFNKHGLYVAIART